MIASFSSKTTRSISAKTAMGSPPPSPEYAETKARIFLIDDHPLLRNSLREFLLRNLPSAEVIGEASESEEAWNEVVRLVPDLVIMDLELPGIGGIELTRRIHETFPRMKVLILTAYGEECKVNGALDAGATGYILKQCSGTEFISACRAALDGQVFLSPIASTIVVRGYQRQLKGSEGRILTAREVEVLRLIADGHATKEIAHVLQISTKTVETIRASIMRKLGIYNIAALTKYAVKQGLSGL